MYILNNLSQFLSNSSNYTKDVVVFFDSIYKFDFITSDYGLTEFASGVWSKLMIDEDYYVYTSGSKYNSEGCSGAIKKNISDDKLNLILYKIKNEVYNIYHIDFDDLIFDNKIKDKMKWK